MRHRLSAEALEIFACPDCRSALQQAEELSCTGCGRRYSTLAGLPCLMPEPDAWRARALQRLEEYLEFSAGRLAGLEFEQRAPGLLPRTRVRLRRIAEALLVERTVIAELLEPLRRGAPHVPSPAALSEEPTAGTVDLFTCYEHVFRDWAWGESESEAALGLSQRLIQAAQLETLPRRIAIFGAGAGRLAADLHRALGALQTLALDLNPLPLLFADRLTQAKNIDLFEFPVAPPSDQHVTVARRLRCPFQVPPGLIFVLADALRAPLASGSLDLVVTPWFIDAVDADPRVTAASVSRVLKAGGLWLNFGPLRFSGATPGLYSIEEVLEIVAASGFEVCAREDARVPYFAAPESGFQRLELVHGFSARKVADAAPLTLPAAGPEWLSDANARLPVLEHWTNVRESAALTQHLLSLVDGERSIAAIADVLAAAWGVEPRTLDHHLQAYLARLLPR